MNKETKEFARSNIERLLNAFQVLMYQGTITNDTKTFLSGIVLNFSSVISNTKVEKDA